MPKFNEKVANAKAKNQNIFLTYSHLPPVAISGFQIFMALTPIKQQAGLHRSAFNYIISNHVHALRQWRCLPYFTLSIHRYKTLS